VADDRLYALWHLIALRGLRKGEACGLPWPDVDLDAGHLVVATQLAQDGWAVIENAPKTDAGHRTVALDADTITVLRTWRARQAAERLEWGPAYADSGRVFTRENGEQLHPGWVSERFERLVRAAGLPPIRLRDLRHGAATLALAAGVDLKTVQEMLGHSQLSVTADTYTSVLPEVARAAAEAVAALVPRAHVGTAGLTSGSPVILNSSTPRPNGVGRGVNPQVRTDSDR
jgi:integrase